MKKTVFCLLLPLFLATSCGHLKAVEDGVIDCAKKGVQAAVADIFGKVNHDLVTPDWTAAQADLTSIGISVGTTVLACALKKASEAFAADFQADSGDGVLLDAHNRAQDYIQSHNYRFAQ